MQVIAKDAYTHITGGTGNPTSCVAEDSHARAEETGGEHGDGPHASSYRGSLGRAIKGVVRGAIASAITGTTGLLGAAVIKKLLPK